MRIVLFTGKGGVGKTTTASATALTCAARGLRTIIVSTDPAHSLADAFDVPLGDEPRSIGPRLDAQQLDARLRFERAWADVREHVVDVLGWAGASAIEAEELAVVPGLDEVFALADIRDHARSDRYDVVVVDCAPTAETLRLLSLPDVLGWYMDKIFTTQRTVTKAVRPLLARVTSMPITPDAVFTAVRRFYDRLDGVRELLTDPVVTSARLVLTPERMVVAEARRTFTYLTLFGYHVDAVIANRVLPAAVTDEWFAPRRARERAVLDEVAAAFDPLPVLTAPLHADEVIGSDALRTFGDALYREHAPEARLGTTPALRVERAGTDLVLSLPVPFTERAEIDLARTDDELLFAVGPYRRALTLPDSLHARVVRTARLRDGRLEIAFADR